MPMFPALLFFAIDMIQPTQSIILIRSKSAFRMFCFENMSDKERP